MKTLNNLEVAKKLAKALYKEDHGMVIFEPNTFDFQDDIPELTVNGNLIKIYDFGISEDGEYFQVTEQNGYITHCLSTKDYIDSPEFATLLSDVYYYSNISWEFGDFELDFLKGFII